MSFSPNSGSRLQSAVKGAILAFILISIETVETGELNLPKGGSELTCLARTIYHEARGESIRGQLAVAQVTLNRRAHPEFPDTICAVISQKNAYPWYYKLRTPFKSHEYKKAERIAKKILWYHEQGVEWGPEKTRASLFFNGVPFSYKRLVFDVKIGNHLFYSMKDTH